MFEVELKYAIADLQAFRQVLHDVGAVQRVSERHADTYFAHPCRDFVQTGEALRVRRIDGRPHVTYKGPKLRGPVKARRELEWPLGPGDSDGQRMTELLVTLGFRAVAEVCKHRQSFDWQQVQEWPLQVTIDQVDQVGCYAEIETIAEDEDQVAAARQAVSAGAERLGLRQPEPRSYLNLLLAGQSDGG